MKRIYRALLYSIAGLKSTWKNEKAFREEILISLVLIPSAFIFAKNGIEFSLLVGSWFIVIITELINTAIETTVDRIGKEEHELSKNAKDTGSAAVFMAILLSVTVWISILFF